MGHHSLQFVPVEGTEKSLCYCKRGMLRVPSRRKCVGIGVRDDEDRGFGEAGGNGHFIDDVEELPVAGIGGIGGDSS